jgi:GTP-binding protein EngB required for normal cell division
MPADNLQPLLDHLLLLITDTETFHGAQCERGGSGKTVPAVAAVLAEFRSMVNGIRNRVIAASHRYNVAFVGAGNVGKSTLLNRLFEADMAPRRNGPCTACPVEFFFGEAYTLSVEYFQSLRKPIYYCECSEDIHSRLTELADSSGAQSSQSIRRVSVTAPLPVLRDNGLVIADTPGFGSAQTEGAEGSHEEALRRYLEKDVAQVFWVILAEQGITKREIEFQRSVFGTRCQDIVVTGSEDFDEKDRDRFRKRFTPLFDSIPPAFHFVSGKTGMGIEELAKRITTLDGRLWAASDQLANLAQDLREWVTRYRANNPYLRLTFWNPATWANWAHNFHGHKLTGILALDS